MLAAFFFFLTFLETGCESRLLLERCQHELLEICFGHRGVWSDRCECICMDSGSEFEIDLLCIHCYLTILEDRKVSSERNE